jgi:hypothetical protein
MEPLGTQCRAAATVCDAEESCDGIGPDCPDDDPVPATTACRPAVDGCDAAEQCTGTSTICPPDLPSHCAAAILTGTLPLSVTGTTAGTCARYVPTCASTGANSNERVYAFTAPATATYRIDTFGSAYDTVLMLRDGASCGAVELGCSDDGPGGGMTSFVEVALTAQQSVFIVVDGYDGAAGAFRLGVRNAADYEGWTCSTAQFGADDGCDCGCGVVDPDCADDSAASCLRCPSCIEPEESCAGSAKVVADDNSSCSGWLCPSGFYGTDDGCDCGCGILDPDCPSDDPVECDFCSACGDPNVTCSDSTLVEVDDNTQCAAAATWTCDPTFYGVLDGCDCGCGIFDPDCTGVTHAACLYCDACGDDTANCGGSASIDPNANALCAAPPEWRCDPLWYDSEILDDCDCGCGAPDPDCASIDASECDYCLPCRDFDTPCANSPAVVAADNTRCL